MDWKQGPPVLVGEKVWWSRNVGDEPQTGYVRWMGKIPDMSSGWIVGVEADKPVKEGDSDGCWKGRRLFECQSKHGVLVPISEIQKFSTRSRQTNTENHSDFKLDDSQLGELTHSDLKNAFARKSQETQLKDRYSALESKLTQWSLTNQTSHRKSVSGLESTKNSPEFADGSIGTHHFMLKLKNQNAKSSLAKKRKKRKPTSEILYKRPLSRRLEDDYPSVKDALYNFNSSRAFEDASKSDSKEYLKELTKDMNDVAGYFKALKEEETVEGRYGKAECDKNLSGFLAMNLPDPNSQIQPKEKKFFSFLKWFKKNKEDPSFKKDGPSSAASSPMFVRRRTSSCESVDTLFSTQTVRSFAYIPPTQYQPSAPPSSLLDFEKSSEENVFVPPQNATEDTESIYDRKKKRKAPDPPRLSRENSLPTTLEHKKPAEDPDDGNKTYHRRTVSESFKDKKAGAYCHVQGKRKAPLPPLTSSLYPNLQKVNNNQYASLNKKKKPAPPPPDIKNNHDSQGLSTDERTTTEHEGHTKNATEQSKTDQNVEPEKEKKAAGSQSSGVNSTKDVSLSPLPSRPWYKRSHRDSSGSNIIRKDLLKGFERKKNKEGEDWMPEVGFSRRSLSTESSHNKFNIFARLEKNEDKRKEEKRKSQISILTNISELDREAAEIIRKEQAEERKKMASKDAKYYSSDSASSHLKSFSDINGEQRKEKEKLPENQKRDNLRENEKGGGEKANSPKPQKWNNHITTNQPVAEPPETEEEGAVGIKIEGRKDDIVQKDDRPKEEETKDKENISRRNPVMEEIQATEKIKPTPHSPNILADVTNSTSSAKTSKPTSINLNYFNVGNKSLNYLNEPWVCQKCTLENPGWRVFCEICSSVKPRFLVKPETKSVPDKPQEKSASNAESQKSEKTEPLTTPKLEILNPTFKESSPLGEDENKKEGDGNENLEDLRKKRMTFFTSKLENLPETGVNDTVSSLTEAEKTKLKRILKEMRNSLTKTPKEEERQVLEEHTADTWHSVKQEQAKEGNVPNSEVSNYSRQMSNDGQKYGVIKKKQPSPPKKEKVIEAYVVTKTTVLEDIIIKEGDKVPKVSAGVQTKSSFPVRNIEAGVNVIRPPPRTKKNAVETLEEAKPNKKKLERPLDLSHIEDHERVRIFTNDDLEELTDRLTRAEGVADFRADIQTMAPDTEMNTVAVNRLLRKLETAINGGDHFVAGVLAKELAMMKINCSVTRQVTNAPSTSKITIDLYVEDKVSHQGPIQIQVSPAMTLLQLKKKVERELRIPMEVQRWILGKKLATDDSKTLGSSGVNRISCAVFLYLVAPDKRRLEAEPPTKVDKKDEVKSLQDTPTAEPKVKTKGWYYNYEEDHYSFCEDTEDESRDASPETNSKTKMDKPKPVGTKNDIKTANIRQSEQSEKPSIFNLKTRDTENDVVKELKLISVNSVKQKVEQLNRTFAENRSPEKVNLKSSESWKCGVCTFVNSPRRLECSACSAKKAMTDKSKTDGRPKFEPQARNEPLRGSDKQEASNGDNIHYKALIELQDADLVPNTEPFSCPICLVDYSLGEGVTLKDCLHTFCRTCLVNTVQYSEDAEVKCPYLDETYSCTSVLQQREIKALVPKGLFELHLAKSVKEAENKTGNAFHCKTPDCKGWCIYEDNVNEFHCPVCKLTNCLTCQAIHSGINCRQYQEMMRDASETDVDAKKTRAMLEEMVEKGEAMACPKCQVVLMKKWGCDWLRCSMCKTEICWVTRGFRWGPGGKGDTSGGCKCDVRGIKCHPKCNYCH